MTLAEIRREVQYVWIRFVGLVLYAVVALVADRLGGAVAIRRGTYFAHRHLAIVHYPTPKLGAKREEHKITELIVGGEDRVETPVRECWMQCDGLKPGLTGPSPLIVAMAVK